MQQPTATPDTNRQAKLQAFDRLLTVMDELRENCPWDRKQTMESLRHLTIEETFELSEAISEADLEEVKVELGDIMLHLVFYSRIASEDKAFDMADVLNGVCEKMIKRHPHIYGDVNVDNEEDVKKNWEQLKMKEGKQEKKTLDGVPGSLPSMIKAMRIQEKARATGFDWEKKADVWQKIEEELQEFKNESEEAKDKQEDELGDLLFSLINYARFLDISPDAALEKTNKKFIKRFNYLEEASKKDGKKLKDMSLEEMDVYWEEAKKL